MCSDATRRAIPRPRRFGLHLPAAASCTLPVSSKTAGTRFRKFMNAYKTLLVAAMLVTPACGFGQASTWKIETPHSEAEVFHPAPGRHQRARAHPGRSPARSRGTRQTLPIRMWKRPWTPPASTPANPNATPKIKGDTFFNIGQNTRSSPSTRRRSSATGDGQFADCRRPDSCRGHKVPSRLAVEGPAAPQPKGDGKMVSGFSATGHHQP